MLRRSGLTHVDDDLVQSGRPCRVVGADPDQMPARGLHDDRYFLGAGVDERSSGRVGDGHDRSEDRFCDDDRDELPRGESDFVEMRSIASELTRERRTRRQPFGGDRLRAGIREDAADAAGHEDRRADSGRIFTSRTHYRAFSGCADSNANAPVRDRPDRFQTTSPRNLPWGAVGYLRVPFALIVAKQQGSALVRDFCDAPIETLLPSIVLVVERRRCRGRVGQLGVILDRGEQRSPPPLEQHHPRDAAGVIPHVVHDWGAEGGHDWPFWKRQMDELLGRLF